MIRIKESKFIFKQVDTHTYYVINITDSHVVPNFYYETKSFKMYNLRKAIHRQCDKFSFLKRKLKEKETKAKKKIDIGRKSTFSLKRKQKILDM